MSFAFVMGRMYSLQMRAHWVAALLVACKATSGPGPQPISNRAVQPTPTLNAGCILHGRIIYSLTGEGVYGASVVAMRSVTGEEEAVVTDDSGEFTLDNRPDYHELAVYYLEGQASRPFPGCLAPLVIRVTESSRGPPIIEW
ncbi:MAG TPA: carboxypeptidase-like regulatory domain-containing protein [Kofleriaceae bacterium]